MTKHSLDTPQFYLTAPQPCPYLPGKHERKVFTHLVGDKAPQVNDMLTHGGFRRSQNIAYRPACEGCRACVSTRVIVDRFFPGKSQKRLHQTQVQTSLARRFRPRPHPNNSRYSDPILMPVTVMAEWST